MYSKISEAYKTYTPELNHLIEDFEAGGKEFGDQDRNTLKLFDLKGKPLNVKSFKVPNLVNKIAYRYFRKSKAQRSFEYAHILLGKGIKTPDPVAYFQESSGIFFGKSFYISRHLNYDFTYRELVHDKTFPNRYEVLKYFTRFTFKLHENGIEFLDHSPGNTLIVVDENGNYEFYLVDLNRMKFHGQPLDYPTRIQNFSRLTPDKYMVLEMSREYARLMSGDGDKVFDDMWAATKKFQNKFQRKRRIKRKFRIGQ